MQVLLFYVYHSLGEQAEEETSIQRELCLKLELVGRVRVASEGINGTLYGSREQLESYMKQTQDTLKRNDIDWKMSQASSAEPEFETLIVKHVKELVSMNRALEYSKEATATHLTPFEFHDKCLKGNVAIIDVRNTYEYAIGHFKNAIDPETRQFSDFEQWFKTKGVHMVQDNQDLLLYCTGGIRCEKASIVVKQCIKNVNVFQLQGGIHRYMEAIKNDSQFLGQNFVFDKRRTQPQCISSQVIGTCITCDQPWELYHDSRRCHKCRILVLVCDGCIQQEARTFCKAHCLLNPHADKTEISKQLESIQIKIKNSKPRSSARRRLNKQHRELGLHFLT